MAICWLTYVFLGLLRAQQTRDDFIPACYEPVFDTPFDVDVIYMTNTIVEATPTTTSDAAYPSPYPYNNDNQNDDYHNSSTVDSSVIAPFLAQWLNQTFYVTWMPTTLSGTSAITVIDPLPANQLAYPTEDSSNTMSAVAGKRMIGNKERAERILSHISNNLKDEDEGVNEPSFTMWSATLPSHRRENRLSTNVFARLGSFDVPSDHWRLLLDYCNSDGILEAWTYITSLNLSAFAVGFCVLAAAIFNFELKRATGFEVRLKAVASEVQMQMIAHGIALEKTEMLKKDIADLNAKMRNQKELQQHVAALVRENQDLSRHICDSTRTTTLLEDKLAIVESQLSASEVALKTAKSTQTQLEEALSESKFSTLEKNKKNLDKNVLLQAQLNALHSIIKDERKTHSELEADIIAKMAEKKLLEATKTMLQGQLDKSLSHSVNMGKHHAAQVQHMRNDKSKSDEQIQKLKTALDGQVGSTETAKQQLKRAHGDLMKAKADSSSLEAGLQRLETELAKVKDNSKELASKKSQLKEENDQLKAAYKALQSTNEQLTSGIREREAVLTDANAHIHTLDKQVVAFVAEKSSLLDQITALQRQVDEEHSVGKAALSGEARAVQNGTTMVTLAMEVKPTEAKAAPGSEQALLPSANGNLEVGDPRGDSLFSGETRVRVHVPEDKKSPVNRTYPPKNNFPPQIAGLDSQDASDQKWTMALQLSHLIDSPTILPDGKYVFELSETQLQGMEKSSYLVNKDPRRTEQHLIMPTKGHVALNSRKTLDKRILRSSLETMGLEQKSNYLDILPGMPSLIRIAGHANSRRRKSIAYGTRDVEMTKDISGRHPPRFCMSLPPYEGDWSSTSVVKAINKGPMAPASVRMHLRQSKIPKLEYDAVPELQVRALTEAFFDVKAKSVSCSYDGTLDWFQPNLADVLAIDDRREAAMQLSSHEVLSIKSGEFPHGVPDKTRSVWSGEVRVKGFHDINVQQTAARQARGLPKQNPKDGYTAYFSGDSPCFDYALTNEDLAMVQATDSPSYRAYEILDERPKRFKFLANVMHSCRQRACFYVLNAVDKESTTTANTPARSGTTTSATFPSGTGSATLGDSSTVGSVKMSGTSATPNKEIATIVTRESGPTRITLNSSESMPSGSGASGVTSIPSTRSYPTGFTLPARAAQPSYRHSSHFGSGLAVSSAPTPIGPRGPQDASAFASTLNNSSRTQPLLNVARLPVRSSNPAILPAGNSLSSSRYAGSATATTSTSALSGSRWATPAATNSTDIPTGPQAARQQPNSTRQSHPRRGRGVGYHQRGSAA